METKRSPLTASQQKILAAIGELTERRGFSPTTREIASALGISAASVHEQIARLEKKGHLRRSPRQARSLEVVGDPSRREPDDIPDIHLARVPIVGRIAAGSPLLAEENCEGEILVDAGSIGTGRFFALKVVGDSMVDAGILDGNLVVVRRQPVAESGDIIAALLGDEATVKRLKIASDGVFLMPENERHRPIPVTDREDFSILGKVVSTVSLPAK